MDLIFNCPKCGQELEVDDSGVGQEINCPSCTQKIRIPDPSAVSTAASGPVPGWGGPTPAANTIAASAAAKEEKHLKVPVHNKPPEKLVARQPVTLAAAAKTTGKQLLVKTIRHSECIESGKDNFDDTVSRFLSTLDEPNLVSVTPLQYTCGDIAGQRPAIDYGVLIIYRS